MIDLAALLAQHMAQRPPMARPDAPSAGFKLGGPVHPTKYETRMVNGKWVLIPTRFGRGKGDPALTPKVTVTPYKPVQ